MAFSSNTTASLLLGLALLLTIACAFPSADPPAPAPPPAPAGGDSGSGGSGNSTAPASGKGECSQQKVCQGSLLKINLKAKIGAGVCVLDSLTKKLLHFPNKCARNVAACSNKSNYKEMEPSKCGSY